MNRVSETQVLQLKHEDRDMKKLMALVLGTVVLAISGAGAAPVRSPRSASPRGRGRHGEAILDLLAFELQEPHTPTTAKGKHWGARKTGCVATTKK